MAALTGSTVASTYKDLLQVSNSNSGIDATLRAVEDGEGTASILKLNTTDVAVATDSGQLKLGASVDVGIKRDAASTLEITDGSTGYGLLQASAISLVNSLGWSSTADPAGGRDVAIERAAAGVAKISDASTGAGTLTCGGFQTGAYTAVADGKGIFNATLNDATGDEVALTLNYTTNKATSGADTGLKIVFTDTASPGVSSITSAYIGSTEYIRDYWDGSNLQRRYRGSQMNTIIYGFQTAANIMTNSTDANNPSYALIASAAPALNFAQNAAGIQFSSNNNADNALDSGITRAGVSLLKITNASTGYGGLVLDANTQQWADTVTLTDNTDTEVVAIAITAGQMIGGRLVYTIVVTDGTDHQSQSGSVTFSAVNKAGTTTATIGEDITPILAESAGGSTLTDAWTIVDSTNIATIKLAANSSLTPTSMFVRYQLFLNSANTVTKKT